MATRNTVQSIATPAMHALKRKSNIKFPPASPFTNLLQLQTRNKSSIPLVCDPSSSVYDRAQHSAASFDEHYNLDDKPNEQSWRKRQMIINKKSPMKPHPLSPPKFIPPSSGYPRSFFPSYAHSGRVGPPSLPPDHVLIHDAESISRMTHAAQVARQLLDYACHPTIAKAGRTTEDIDSLVHDKALASGAYPSPLNYMGFPKSVCSSINEVVCHGIPDSRILKEGDVVSFDVSCYIGGVHGDNCATIVVGDYDEKYVEGLSNADGGIDNYSATSSEKDQPIISVDKDWRSIPYRTDFSSDEDMERFVTARRLVQASLESRDEGVNACKPGGCLTDIGAAIHAVADGYG